MKIRQLKNSDRDFVTSYWIKNYRSRAKDIPSSVYFKEHRRLINKALDRCQTFVIVDPQDEDHLIGFINFYKGTTLTVLNYVFIKKSFRQHKLGKELFKAMETFCESKQGDALTVTHKGDLKRLPELFSKITYNPYLFYLK